MTGGMLDRGLPASIIDLIHNGVPEHELKARGDRAVWAALRRTALSAAARGWERWEWEPLVLQPNRRLGEQARVRSGSKMRNGKKVSGPIRARTPAQLAKQLDSAWTSATDWLSEQPMPLSREAVRAQGNTRAEVVLLVVADPDARLSDNERAVLAYAAGMIRDYNAAGKALDRVALPRKQMLAATGLGLTALRTTLRRLQDRQLLTLAEAGRRREPGAHKGIANVYALPDVERVRSLLVYRETRSVVPLVHLSSAPAPELSGAPRHLSSAPVSTNQETPMVTLTMSASNAEELVAALALLRQETAVRIDVPVNNDVVLPSNVKPLRSRGGREQAS